jgi:hypothetical protein
MHIRFNKLSMFLCGLVLFRLDEHAFLGDIILKIVDLFFYLYQT